MAGYWSNSFFGVFLRTETKSLSTLLAIDHHISNPRSWNHCSIYFPRGMLREHEKSSKITSRRRVIHKLLECSPNIPSGLLCQ